MPTLRDVFVRLGVKTDPRGFRGAEDGLKRITDAAKVAVTALAGLKLVQVARGFAEEVRGMGDRLDKVSQQIGVTTDALQELEFAGGLAGASQDEVSAALRLLARNAYEASLGTKEYTENFDAMGIVVTDTSGKLKSADELLMEVADGMTRLSTDTERTALAQTVLGRSGAKLIPLLKQGSAAIREQRKEARELGLLQKEEIATAVELTDNQLRLEKSYNTIKFAVAKGLMPAINAATTSITAFIRANGDVIRQGLTRFFEKATRVIGSVVDLFGMLIDTVYDWGRGLDGVAAVLLRVAAIAAGIAAILLLPAGAILLLIGLVALLIDDFMTWRKGGDSLIGDLIDGFKALGQEIAGWASDAMDAVVGAWTAIGDAVLGTIAEITGAIAAWFEAYRTTISLVTSMAMGFASVWAASWVSAHRRAIALAAEWHARQLVFMARVKVAAVKSSVLAGAAWVKSAVVSSVAWLKAQLTMGPGFLSLAATAVSSAVASGAAWVVAAVKAAAAWLVATGPVILMGVLLGIIVGTVIWLGRELYRLATGSENFFTTMSEGFGDLVEQFGSIPEAIGAMLDEALRFWLKFFGATSDEIDTWIDAATDTLQGFWDNVLTYWGDKAKAFFGWVTDLLPDFITGGDGATPPAPRRPAGRPAPREAGRAAAGGLANLPLPSVIAPGGARIGGRPGLNNGPVVHNNRTSNVSVDVKAAPGMDERRLAEYTAQEVQRALEAESRFTAQSFALEAP